MPTTLARKDALIVFVFCTVSLHAGGSPTFSLPDSVLLFGTYDELRIATPGGAETIKPPVDLKANGGIFTSPSISPRGNLIAWGFATQMQGSPAGLRAKFSLGIYSVTNRTWKTYGEFDGVGSASFSPDGSHVAFIAGERGNQEGLLLVLDLDSGNMKSLAHPAMWGRTTLSWSPDSKRIALTMAQVSKNNPTIAILELETGSIQPLVEGLDPTWSPTGEWIAYFDPAGANCLVVHPDGTGVRTVRTLRQSWFSYKQFGWSGPVWSPDGRQMLVSEMKGDGNYIAVELIDLASGRAKKKTGDGLPVFGWASRH